jgi:hypothetical protein
LDGRETSPERVSRVRILPWFAAVDRPGVGRAADCVARWERRPIVVSAGESPGGRAVEDHAVSRRVMVECGHDHRCLFRHLMLAAEEIASPGGPAAREGRFAAVAARFRDLSYGPRRKGVGPVVVGEDGIVVPLSDLLAKAWLREREAFPGQGIDADLLEAARQLLLGLAWSLPDP